MKHLKTTLKFAVAVAALLTVATGVMACTGQNGDSWLEKIGIHTEPGDTVPPTIQVFPMQANVGETPDFMKNVVASDSCSSVTIKVDSREPYIESYDMFDIHDIANVERKVPLSWITNDGTYVSDEYLAYARPFIIGSVQPYTAGGLPIHLTMNKKRKK